MADGQVVFEIKGDSKGVKKTLDDVTRDIEKAGKQWDNTVDTAADDMTKSMNRAFDVNRVKDWAIAAGKAIMDFMGDAIRAASDLEEVQNVVDTTFGESAAEIERWAKTAQTQYGLTETQAKRFTSTLGAMAKSAGLAGPEIVGMSEDLAGLAADMASFYNLDFDTAFQKIRSGISGETEPLRQLGINMSVANLQAFALTQGITKAFDQMSQGEQTMLRYQYLMQATADAQGDFARTSDGYANSMRLLETNMESLKTTLGTALIPVVSSAVTALNNLLGSLTTPREDTILDELAAIDLKTDEKIRQIQDTAAEAKLLVDLLEEMNTTSAGDAISALADGANVLNSSSPGLWKNLLGAFDSVGGLDGLFGGSSDAGSQTEALATGANSLKSDSPDDWARLLGTLREIDGLNNLFGDNGAAGNVSELADALSNANLDGDRAEAWQTLMGALGDNAEAVSALTGDSVGDTKAWFSGLAEAANDLDPADVAAWDALLNELVSGLPGLNAALQTNSGSIGQGMDELAAALSGNSEAMGRAEAWNVLLSTLRDNASALTALTGEDAEGTAAWLDSLAEAANGLDPNSAEGWNTLLGDLVKGLPGLESTPEGQQFFNSIKTELLALGTDSASARAGLEALGMSSDEIDSAQRRWLATCKELVSTIPGLSSIINTQTGEVKGGTSAIQAYVEEWEKLKTLEAQLSAVEQKREAIISASDIDGRYVEMRLAEERLKRARDAMAAEGYDPNNAILGARTGGARVRELAVAVDEAEKALETARAGYENAILAQQQDLDALAQIEAELQAQQRELGASASEAAQSLSDMQLAAAGDTDALARVQTVIQTTTTALRAMTDYQEATRDATARTISSVVGGLNSIETPAERVRKQMHDITEEIAALGDSDTSELDKTFASLKDSLPSAQNMAKALQSQLEYMREYQANLAEAERRGVNKELLASLSDGSVESADYLAALATASEGEIETLNEVYRAVEDEKSAFTDALTESTLAADTAYQDLVSAADAAMEELDKSGAASMAGSNTVQGLIDGLESLRPSLAAEVDALLAELDRLSNYGGVSVSGGVGLFTGLNGSHAGGLDYVPFDNYLAALHEGESVLSAEEAKMWRTFRDGGTRAQSGIDYGALSGAIWDNAPDMGGNVYLDGRTVGRVISQQQASSYRQLERSGWQG